MRIAPMVVLLSLSVAAPPLSAQSIVDTPNGKVQLLGLETWTIGAVRDSLRALGTDLGESWCPAALRDQLGFADVNLLWSHVPETGEKLLIYTVQEQAPAAGVVPPRMLEPAGPDDPAYASLLRLWDERPEHVQHSLQKPALLYGDPSPDSLLVYPFAARLRTALRDFATAEAQERARWQLNHDGNPRNRMAAAMVLARGGEYDATYWALAKSMLDADLMVQTVAIQVLGTLTRGQPRPVNWRPARADLRALGTGLNLMGFGAVLQALSRTEPDAATTAEFVASSKRLLLSWLQMDDSYRVTGTIAPLRRMTGLALGDDPAAWTAWLEQQGQTVLQGR